MKKRWMQSLAVLLCMVLLFSGCNSNSASSDSTDSMDSTDVTESVRSTETAKTSEDAENMGNTGNDANSDNDGTTGNTGDIGNNGTADSGNSTGTNKNTNTTTQIDANGDGIVDIGYDTLPCTEEELYDQLFDLNNEIHVQIDMSDAELLKLQEDYEYYSGKGAKSPIYRKADVLITIITAEDSTTYRIEDVGVRMKGNTSRTSFYNTNEGIYKYIHLKLDFQETFDDEEYYGKDTVVWDSKAERTARKNRTFATLEKLEMRWNKCYDSTYLKETYAYELYRSEGVLAPLTNLCSFDWSGVHMGVYTINEPVDEVFLAKRLEEKDLGGDLYKCGWTNEGASFTSTSSIGIEDEGAGKFYCYDLKTNKKTSTHESLKNLINQLNSGLMTKEKFEKLVDVDNFLSYAAVSYFLGNPDDLRNNYNNFYLYFLKSSGKAVIIPYDYDRCLGVTVDYNPSGHAMTKDNPFSDKREGAQGGAATQDNPLFIYSVDKGGYYVAEYAEVLNRVSKNDLLTVSTFTSYFNRAKSMYQDDVKPGKTLRNAEGRNFSFDLNRTSSASSCDNMSFSDYITAKMNSFNSYMKKVDEYSKDTVSQRTNYYIRGDFTDWNVNDEYSMELENGKLVYTLSFNHDFKFKIYNKTQDEWMGSECLAEAASVSYDTDDHTNIILKSGTYKVVFDPETMIITITKK